MLVISYVPVLFLFTVSVFFFVSLFASTDSLTHSSQKGMYGRKRMQKGREGGKASKVLPACGAHRLILWSSAGLEKRERGQCVCVCVCWGRGAKIVNTIPHLLLQQTIHAVIESLEGWGGEWWLLEAQPFFHEREGRLALKAQIAPQSTLVKMGATGSGRVISQTLTVILPACLSALPSSLSDFFCANNYTGSQIQQSLS